MGKATEVSRRRFVTSALSATALGALPARSMADSKEGAEMTAPLKEQFFGTYGALNDKFGVRWMFQTDKKS